MQTRVWAVLAAGMMAMLVPVLLPVWQRSWTQTQYPLVGSPVKGGLDTYDRSQSISVTTRNEPARAVLFLPPTAPPKEQPHNQGGPPGPLYGPDIQALVLTVNSDYQASPNIGRMLGEALIVFLPFAIAAFVLSRASRPALAQAPQGAFPVKPLD